MGTITVKPGETLQIVGVPADTQLPPYIPGPVDPGFSPPWAQVPPGGQGGGPVDPGYSPPWAQVRPPVDPGYSPPWAQVPGKPPLPPGPVDPGYSPPWATVPDDTGNWVWGYSPQQKRWVWVRVPGEGEAGPK